MTRSLRAAAGLAVAVAFGPTALSDTSQTPDDPLLGAFLSGQVLTATNPPVPSRQVTVLLAVGAEVARSGVTDDEGKFEFRDVLPGTYRLRAVKPAFLPSEYGATEISGAGTPVDVSSATVATGLNILLVRGAVVSGVIRDVEGAPAPGVVVTAWGGVEGMRQTWTNHLGEYRIYGLAPAEYRISAEPSQDQRRYTDEATVPSRAEVDAALAELRAGIPRRPVAVATPRQSPETPGRTAAAGTSTITGYAPVFYPGTVDREASARIFLEAGDEVSGLDIRLVLTGGSRLSGTVRHADGTPIDTGLVMAVSRSESRPVVARASIAGGRFEIVNLPPGMYTLEARVTAAVGQEVRALAELGQPENSAPVPRRWWAAADVSAGYGDLTGIALTVQPAMRIVGRAVFEGANSANPATASGLELQLVRLYGRVDAAGPPSASAAIRADGRFVLDDILPGTYRLRLRAPTDEESGWWLRSMTSAGREILDVPLELGLSRGSIEDAALTLSTRHTRLFGHLVGADGKQAPGYHVVLFPVAREAWQPMSRRLPSTRPTSSGQFEFVDVPPGDYYLAVLTVLEADRWQEPSSLEQAAAAAVRVSIQEGEQRRQDLQLSGASPRDR